MVENEHRKHNNEPNQIRKGIIMLFLSDYDDVDDSVANKLFFRMLAPFAQHHLQKCSFLEIAIAQGNMNFFPCNGVIVLA